MPPKYVDTPGLRGGPRGARRPIRTGLAQRIIFTDRVTASAALRTLSPALAACDFTRRRGRRYILSECAGLDYAGREI